MTLRQLYYRYRRKCWLCDKRGATWRDALGMWAHTGCVTDFDCQAIKKLGFE